MYVLRDIATFKLVESDPCFRGSYCFHRRGVLFMAMWMCHARLARISVTKLDGRMFWFTRAATIRQLLEITEGIKGGNG
jgi:hypothetical protein